MRCENRTSALLRLRLYIVGVLVLGVVFCWPYIRPHFLFSSARTQRNDTNAIGALKEYVTAQTTYRKQDYSGANGGTSNNYCPSMPRLSTDTDASGQRIYLIPTPMSMATPGGTPYQGYVFIDRTGIDWSTDYGLAAIPVRPGKDGKDTFLIRSTDEQVWMKDTRGAPPTAADWADPGARGWTVR